MNRPGRVAGFVATMFVAATMTGVARQGGAARLSGVVTNGEAAPLPVRRAIVTLGGGAADGRAVVTDDRGRFDFTGLPPGRYTITASKAAYLTNAYGAKAPGRPGTALTLAAGQSTTDVQVTLPRGATISGTIRDYTGDPAPLMPVYVMALADAEAGQVVGTESAVTDDQGQYRIYGLAAGTYLVASSPRISISGVSARSTEEVDALIHDQQQVRAGIAPGRASGPPVRPAAAPAMGNAPPSAADGRIVSYAPVYYPGTVLWAEASRITVHAGEDQSGIDFSYALVPVATVRGSIVAPSGELPEMAIAMIPDGPTFPGVAGVRLSPIRRPGVGGDPSFTIPNVPPGHYVLTARTAFMKTTLAPDGRVMSGMSIPPGSVPALWGQTEIDVRDAEVGGVTITVQPSVTVSGYITFDARSLTPPGFLENVRITAAPPTLRAQPIAAAVNEALGVATSVSGVTDQDGAFELVGLAPGKYAITAPRIPNWQLASAMLDGRDVLDTLLDVSAGKNLSDLVITYTDHPSSLSGALTTTAGQPALDYFVVVFPADRGLWRVGARRVRSSKPASDGHFTFADLPPGPYFLAAVTDAASDDWQQPAFLESLAASALSLTVAPGEKKVQDIRIAGGSAPPARR